MIEIAFSSPILAHAAARFSQEATVRERDGHWVVRAKRVVISHAAVTAALGRLPTAAEEEELACRMPEMSKLSYWRCGDLTVVEPVSPSCAWMVRISAVLEAYIKAQANARRMTARQFVCFALEWFMLTFGEAPLDLQSLVEAKYADLHRLDGIPSRVGFVSEERVLARRAARRMPYVHGTKAYEGEEE